MTSLLESKTSFCSEHNLVVCKDCLPWEFHFGFKDAIESMPKTFQLCVKVCDEVCWRADTMYTFFIWENEPSTH